MAMTSRPSSIGFLKAAQVLVATAPRVFPHEVEFQADGVTPVRDFKIHLLKDRIKYVLRGLATPRLTREWFEFLSQPGMGAIICSRPRLYSKLQRPYLHRKLRQREQIQILKEHYGFALRAFSPDNLKKIYATREMTLADLPLGEAGHYALRLQYLFEKEGELAIVLADRNAPQKNGRDLVCAISFSVTSQAEGSRAAMIGGLQTSKHNRERIVPITRAMHGLRPKGLLLFAVQQLATLWGITTLRAVSNDMTVFRHVRLRKKNVQADYDEFWVESDGQLDASGLFTLPTAFAPRPIAEIRVNKRGTYKKRYAMLEEIGRQIADCARQFGPSAAPSLSL